MIRIDETRGDRVESTHHCSLAVVDGDGHLVAEFGDVSQPVYPRSAVKLIQALPVVESGAADAYHFSEEDLALCCASHSGEDRHAARAAAMLEKLGLDETALRCGPNWPFDPAIARSYAADGGTPRPLRHNCSGKHCGFLCLSCFFESDDKEYHLPEHDVQRRVTAALQQVTGFELTAAPAVDGCSIPTHAIPLRALAHGFARLATGNGLGTARAAAAKRLFAACMNHPEMVAGVNRFDSRIMAAGNGRILAKMGAQGVYCGALPDKGLGFAVKCHDGAVVPAEIAFGAAIAAFHGTVMQYQDRQPILSAVGSMVGQIAPDRDYFK